MSITGLLLAGFIVGSLGVLNDVTITQASTVFELALAGDTTRRAVFLGAMRVGRDHIASTVYTLVLALRAVRYRCCCCSAWPTDRSATC